jgi:predicted nucleic acid-binding protein
MFKQNRLTFEEARKGLNIFESIPVQYIKTDFINVVSISRQTHMYAYDAYFLDCAIRQNAPLLTLDRKLIAVAKSLKLSTLEV